MRHLRRPDHAPRVEMLPLIDVIFLLLTFFIYSIVVMVRAEVLPVQLTPLTAGSAPEAGEVAAITIAGDGSLHLNRDPITDDQLSDWLDTIAKSASPPRVLIAMENKSNQDRGPVLLTLFEALSTRGISDFAIIGEPVTMPPPGPSPATPATPPTPATPAEAP